MSVKKKEAAAQPPADPAAQQATAQALLEQHGLTPEVLQSMLAPIIKQTMVDILKGSALEKSAIEFQEMKATLAPVIDRIKAAGLGGDGAPVETAGTPPPGGGALGDLVMQYLLKQMGGGQQAGNPIDSLAATLESVQKIAALANKPYGEGRRDALSETNEMLRLLTGAGAPPEKRSKILADTIAKELGGDGTGE